jgi:cytochrome P450
MIVALYDCPTNLTQETESMVDKAGDVKPFPMPRDSRCPFNPPPELKQLQKDAPVSKVRIWNGSTPWLVTRYEDVRMVLRDERFSSNAKRPGFPPMSPSHATRRTELHPDVFALDNPEHNVYRKMQNSDFLIHRVDGMRPRVQQIVDEAIDELLAAGPGSDLVKFVSLPVPSLVICELLGIPFADHEFFQRTSKTLASTLSTQEESAAALDELRAYMEKLVARKEQEPANDYVSRMAEHVKSGQLTRTNVANMSVNLLSAGHNTTANTITLATALLLEHPDQLADFRAGDQKFVANAVEELLRFIDVPHLGRRRVALEDVVVGGQLIKAGEGVIAAQMIADRDESAFPSPDSLDLRREARHHMGFGFGTHQCLGQPLARLEMQVALSTLFRRIPTLKLAVPREELRFNYDGLIYGLRELPLSWDAEGTTK